MRDCVVIVGSGMMGSGIGAMSALAGNKTVLVDVDLVKAQSGRENAVRCIKMRQENELNTMEEANRAIELLECGDNISGAVKHARLVIEAIIENMEAKQKLFAQLDELLPVDVPICSNTSGLRITDISAKCKYPERTVTTHFWLPAHLIPLVEVVVGERTDEKVAFLVREELKKWKKCPVLVKKDLPGQLANRIFQAIIREAIDIVESGLASAEDVDVAIASGMAMRFPVWGPLMHLDAIGTDLGLAVQDAVLPSICANRSAGDYIRTMVQDGYMGVKAGRGFYDWSSYDIDECIHIRDRFIVEAVKAVARVKQ